MKLSPHFTLEELTFSDTAIRHGVVNVPTKEMIVQLTWLAQRLEDVRGLVGPMHISSGYRCLDLNRLLKSKDTSQHILGEAADFVSLNGKTPLQMCRIIEESDLVFDQLIFEYRRWVHISFSQRYEPRGSVLTIDGAGVQIGLVEGE